MVGPFRCDPGTHLYHSRSQHFWRVLAVVLFFRKPTEIMLYRDLHMCLGQQNEEKKLVVQGRDLLHRYIGIIIRHCKDPY